MEHFGLHIDDDLVFLHQQGQEVCLTPGLAGLKSPFLSPKRLRCPHRIEPKAGEVGRAPSPFDPVPDGGAYWVPGGPFRKADMTRLAQMSGPTQGVGIIRPFWAWSVKDLMPELNLTNIAPLIITSYEAQHLRPIGRLLELPRIRTLIFCGDVQPAGTEIAPIPEIDGDPRAAGAAALHEFVQRTVEKARA
jgi:hypothetical protein